MTSGRHELLRVKEAAEVLGLGTTTTWGLIAKGDLQIVRIGKAVRVPASELERFIRERTAKWERRTP